MIDFRFYNEFDKFVEKWNKKYQQIFNKNCKCEIVKIILDNIEKIKNQINNQSIEVILSCFDELIAADFAKYEKS